MTTLYLRESIDRSPLRRGLPRVQAIWIIRGSLLITLALACFALLLAPNAFAVSPAPDGGYPGGNTAEGASALFSLSTGVQNTALGHQTLFHLTTGSQNTATGFQTLLSNTTGSSNVANGSQALYHNTEGSFDTATGFRTLYSNTTGTHNTGNGFEALNSNTTGLFNTAIGYRALYNNTTALANTANGFQALYSDTTGGANVANGYQALFNNTTGTFNTANGGQALLRNTTGGGNTANGGQALLRNTTGGENTADGINALSNNTIGSNNVALGFDAGLNLTTGSNNIDIGAVGVSGESDTIRLGRFGTQTSTFIVGISGSTIPSGVSVIIDSFGHLGTINSSARYKEAIRPMDKASEAILALRPVTFRYKHQLDPEGIPQFGLVAEEVEKVNANLVVRDEKGEVYSVRYDQVNAMLLNEFLKEHRKVEKQEATIARLQKQVEALTAGLQKVSAQVEVLKPAPQTVLNNH
jgi:hypothetical protein